MLHEAIFPDCEIQEIKQRKILSKHCYYKLSESGILGNTPKSWRNLQELKQSGFHGKVHIRYMVPQSLFIKENVQEKDLEKAVKDLEKLGADRRYMKFSESLDDNDIVLSGIISRSEEYYDLYFTHEKISLRKAEGVKGLMQFATGLFAHGMLRAFLCWSSYEDLQSIFDLFPDSIVEFTVYKRDVGTLPGRNTIFWEVRNF